jgi:hypothetical protein
MDNNDALNFFDNYKFFYDPPTGEVKIKFICNDCHKVITKNELGNYNYTVTKSNIPEYHKAKFWCKECFFHKKEDNIITHPEPELISKNFKKEKENIDVLDKIYASLYNGLGVNSDTFSKSPIINKLHDKYHDDSIEARIIAHNYLETNLKNIK